MTHRIKTGPRTAFGYLDTALGDLLEQAEATGKDSKPVANKRRAILERVRRIVRTERKAWDR